MMELYERNLDLVQFVAMGERNAVALIHLCQPSPVNLILKSCLLVINATKTASRLLICRSLVMGSCHASENSRN